MLLPWWCVHLQCTCFFHAVFESVCVCVCVCVCVQEVGTLEVSGYVRGRPLSVNGLLHIPGLGDFQMTKVQHPLPFPHHSSGIGNVNSNVGRLCTCLHLSSPSLLPLQITAPPDPHPVKAPHQRPRAMDTVSQTLLVLWERFLLHGCTVCSRGSVK